MRSDKYLVGVHDKKSDLRFCKIEGSKRSKMNENRGQLD